MKKQSRHGRRGGTRSIKDLSPFDLKTADVKGGGFSIGGLVKGIVSAPFKAVASVA